MLLTGLTDSVNLKLSSAALLDATAGVTIAGVETINITNTDTDTTAHTNLLSLTADTATSIVVHGNAGLDLTGSIYAKVTSFDASGVTGAATDAAALAVTFASANTTIGAVVSIKGGSGDDVLTGSANGNDTIVGGAGIDTITYTGGLDTFTGGAGNDIFVTTALGTATANMVIADLTAGDTIDFSAIFTVGAVTAEKMNAAETVLGSAATFQQYLDNASSTAGTQFGAAGSDAISWFQFENNTYIVLDNTNGTQTFTAADSVIKITGLVDLSASSVSAGNILTVA